MNECVNCHNRVLPKSDGTCPSCRAPVDRIAGADSLARTDQTLLTVFETDRLPDLCCRCAQPTQRRTTFSFSRRADDQRTMVALLGLLGLLIDRFMGRSRLRVAMPDCKLCHRAARLRPRDVRFEDFTMQFEVHREFRRVVEAARSSAK
jgi:hypothetical protein